MLEATKAMVRELGEEDLAALRAWLAETEAPRREE